ncbi:MAG: acetoacetate--CoA ligase [Myxococcota bacterium]
MDAPLWTPSDDRVRRSRMWEWMSERGETDFRSFHRWSVDDPEAFWSELWDRCGVRGERRSDRVLVDGERMPGARWFPDSRLEFTDNLLWKRDDDPAIVACDELGRRRELTYAELYASVGRFAAALRREGVGVGDRVAGMLPNGPEAVIAALAAARVGALWSSCSPDFGARGVLDRFGQIEPRVLFACDGYHYGGRSFDVGERVDAVAAELPSLRRVVVVPFLDESTAGPAHTPTDPRCSRLDDWVRTGGGDEVPGTPLPFDHPVYVLYSSGTTGRPKCIVHGAGGTLLQHLKEHRLHLDLREGERFFYFTTCGWMMWNWLVSGLASGATLVLYDGSPFHPGPDAVFALAERERLDVLGVSAKFLDAAAKAGVEPAADRDLSTVRTILSTGSPLSPEGFDYVYEHVKSDVQLASISGGTDILSCFVLGEPTSPVWRGEIQAPGLGMRVRVFDGRGRGVIDERGELVCRQPFPSMPVGFWRDPEQKRYRAAYFERFPGVWCHGDWCRETLHGGFVIEGRSDAVLNPGGVRIGTAEIYAQVERIDEIVEAIAVGQQWQDDVRVVLFVRLRDGLTLDDALRDRVRRALRENASPRHVPAVIAQVDDIPRTRSGKITELAVRDVIHGRPVGNVEALANPEALDGFRERAELAG